jgi:D-alanyl-D-alanine carboxypeptidase
VTSTEEVTTAPPFTGWLYEGHNAYYYINDVATVGWLELEGDTYYFPEDGTMAKGEVLIGDNFFHFSSQGKRFVLVNPWHYTPYDYQLDLVDLGSEYAAGGCQIQRCAYDDLVAMITDCNLVCPQAKVVSAYRSHEQQTRNYNNRVQQYVGQGYSLEEARQQTGMVIAVPGTSEHELGLAVDIIDTRLWALEREQADLPAQQWLMENSWKYGFILRYPNNKTDITGIIYEPWHYRYVGRELAAELHELGLTLEEYILSLTDAVG